MSGLPIKGWNDLVNGLNWNRLLFAIESLNKEDKATPFYRYTYDSYNVAVSDSPIEIVNLSNLENNYFKIIIRNFSGNPIYLYIGEDETNQLQQRSSGMVIDPFAGLIISDYPDLILSAIAQDTSSLGITIHATRPKLGGETEDMPIPLNISLFASTDKSDIPLDPYYDNDASYEIIFDMLIWGRDKYENHYDPGRYNLARLKSYQPGTEYTFNVVIDPTFAGSDEIESDDPALPIRVQLFDRFQLENLIKLGLGFTYEFSIKDSYWASLDDQVDYWVSWLSERSLVTSLPLTGGSFSITPIDDLFIHFSVLDEDRSNINWYKAVKILSYDEITNTFTIGGF